MKLAQLLHFVDRFFKLAGASEDLPEDSKDIKTVLKNLSKIETHSVRVEYAERNLDHLSSGTSRVVFTLPGKKEVLKLAKNDRGVAQNEAEAGLTCKYVNKTLQACPNDYWKTSPFLDKITEKEFEKLTGANFKDFGNALEYELRDVSGSKVDKPKNLDKMKELDIFKELVKLGKKHQLMPADMSRISSWGKIDDHPTLLDAGLTREIYDEFY
jgi:hypothetical protein